MYFVELNQVKTIAVFKSIYFVFFCWVLGVDEGVFLQQLLTFFLLFTIIV